MKKTLLAFIFAAVPLCLNGQNLPVNGFCEQGATPASVQGIPSVNNLQGVISACTVKVFLTGTQTLATIYSNAGGSSLSNPFNASSSGQWIFYSATGQGYDVVLYGGGNNPNCNTAPACYTTPVTITGVFASGSSASPPAAPKFAVQYSNSGVTGFTSDASNLNAYLTSTSNNGIALTLAECSSFPYACQILAPSLYPLTEIPAWTRFNFGNNGVQQTSQATPVMLTDERGGANFVTIVDPYNAANYAALNPSTFFGTFVANQIKVDFTGLPPSYAPGTTFNANMVGAIHTQGGVLSQLYDFPYQSQLFIENWVSEKNTSEGGGGTRLFVSCLAPGDCVGQNMRLYGPAGAYHPQDEGQEYFSTINSATTDVYRGSISIVGTGTVNVTPAGFITTWSGNGTTLTLTASDTYIVGNSIGFSACGGGLSALNNTYQTVTAVPTSTSFQIASAISGSGTTACTMVDTASGETIAGTQGENRWLIDTQGGGTTYTGSALTDNVQPIACGSAYDYATTMAATTSVPTSSAWGCLTSAVTVPSASLTPGVQSPTVNLLHGSLTTGIACVADLSITGGGGQHGNFETVNITAAPSGSFTANFDKSHPVGGMVYQGGMCDTFMDISGSDMPTGTAWSNGEGTGTTTYPVRYTWPVLGSVDGTNVIMWTGKAGSATDADWASYTNKTFVLFPGAEVYKVAGVTNDTTDNLFSLAPNNVSWTVGDFAEEDQYPYQKTTVGDLQTSQWLPNTGIGNFRIFLYGRVEGATTGVAVNNHAAQSNYSYDGGTWNLPVAAYDIEGPWQAGVRDNAPTQWFIGLPCGSTINNCGTVQKIVNPGYISDSDYFAYTNTNGNGQGGTWTLSGNAAVTGNLTVNGTIATTAAYVPGTGDPVCYDLGTWIQGTGRSNTFQAVISGGSNQSSNLSQFYDTATIYALKGLGSAAPNIQVPYFRLSGQAGFFNAAWFIATGGSTSPTNASWDLVVMVGKSSQGMLVAPNVVNGDTWTLNPSIAAISCPASGSTTTSVQATLSASDDAIGGKIMTSRTGASVLGADNYILFPTPTFQASATTGTFWTGSLVNGTTYYYKVRTSNDNVNWSPQSAEGTVVASSTGAIKIQVQGAEQNLLGQYIMIERSTSSGAEVPLVTLTAPQVAYVDTGTSTSGSDPGTQTTPVGPEIAGTRVVGVGTAGHLAVYGTTNTLVDGGAPPPLIGTSASIGGSALLVNNCSTGTATVTGVTSAMAVVVTPVADPNGATTQDYDWYGYMSGTNTVTVKVCAIVAGTPAATTYNVRAF